MRLFCCFFIIWFETAIKAAWVSLNDYIIKALDEKIERDAKEHPQA
jgi:hypothetical protein